MKERIGRALQKIEGSKEGEGRGWWDKDCREKKGRVRRELRKWRRVGESGETYRKKGSEYKKLCEEKKRQEIERWSKEVEQARTESGIEDREQGEKEGEKDK